MTLSYRLFTEPDLDFNTPIYRFVPWRWLRDLLIDGNLTLVRPENWDDPYELIHRPVQVRIVDGSGARAQKVLDASGFEVFSQSWTTKNMADTMLRAYSKLSREEDGIEPFDPASHANEAVQISTTVGKLHDTIAHGLQHSSWFERLYVGRVKYLSEDALANRVVATYAHGPDVGKDPACVASLLLVKRDAYEAEQEIRPIVLLNEAGRDLTVLKVKIDPQVLIDSITIDPRVRSREVSGLGMRAYQDRFALLREWGFATKICESHLYSASPMFEAILELDSPKCALSRESKARWRIFLEQHQIPTGLLS